MSYLEKIDVYIDSLKVGKSAMVDKWFMMSSPVPMLTVVMLYVLLVHFGPRLMKNRPPMNVHSLITCYNAAQVVLSLVICYKSMRLNLFRDGFLNAGCRYPSSTQSIDLLDCGWWYFFAKFTELLDTVFFIVRKKENQISFLHVYHHGTMALYSWSYLKYAAGGQGAVLALLNSAIHVLMYTYYLFSGLGPKFQKYLWWKKYVTKLQLIQFVFMLTYCVWTHFLPHCHFAHGFTYFITVNVSLYLLLFLNFYTKSYKKREIPSYENLKNETVAPKAQKNGFAKIINGDMKPDFMCTNNHKDSKEGSLDNNIAYEVNKACGDYIKDGRVYLTRRTAKAAFGADYDFDSIIKK